MRLVIVRHGQSTANAENRWQGQMDFDLSSEGRKQAESLGARFVSEGFRPKFVYSSPLKRAVHTAEISLPDKRVFEIDDLKETGIGIFEGLTMEEALGSLQSHLADRSGNEAIDGTAGTSSGKHLSQAMLKQILATRKAELYGYEHYHTRFPGETGGSSSALGMFYRRKERSGDAIRQPRPFRP